jgi:hypothetical protein
MRPTGKLLAILLALALAGIAVPATVLAQSAGDDQYVDPFQGGGGGGGGGNGGGGNGGGGDAQSGSGNGSTTTTTTTPSDTGTGAAEGASSASDGSTLPRTGLSLLPVVLTGLFLFGAGLAVRRPTPAELAPALASPSIAAVPQRARTEPATASRTRLPLVRIGLGLIGVVLLSLLRRRA